jgi:flagellar biosynthesis protein FlhF
MARLRAALGDDAVIVATQELASGEVRITGATEDDDVDLADLLAAPAESPWVGRLAALAAHHELPEGVRHGLLEAARDLVADVDPTTALGHALHQVCRFAPLPTTARLLLAGPPGAGKTASIAKLAAAAALAGRPVSVVCADTARAAGIEQLAALLAPLELRPEPAPDLASLRSAVARAGGAQLLIDSPGFNPFRPADLGLLSGLLEASRAVPVLVLPAGLGVADCTEIGHTYAALGARHLLATKLDAARRLGGLLAAADAGLAFAEAGIGRTIGQGLSALSARGLARLLLCQQELSAAGTAPATGKPK